MATGQVHAFEFGSDEFAYNLVKNIFYDYIYKRHHITIPTTRENVKNIISVLKSDNATVKAPYGSNYYVKTIDNKDVLLLKTAKHISEVVPIQECFDVIAEAHLTLGHAKVHSTFNAVIRKYYAPLKWIRFFVNICNVCQQKKNFKKGTISKNNLKKETISGNNLKKRKVSENKAYLFIENFQDLKEDEYNVLFYIDQISQYVLLRPLQKNANKEEIAFELLKIFTNFGVPGWILTCLNFELINEALEILTTFNLPLDMPLIGKSSNERQWDTLIDSVKSSISTAESAIDNGSWTITLYLMQFQNNTCDRIPSNSLSTPYCNLFGMAPNISRSEENVIETSSCIEANACGECFRQIYKKYQCHNCKEYFHFTCCTRYLQAKHDDLNQIMVMCFSCKRALEKK